MKTRLIIILGVILVSLLGLAFFTGGKNDSSVLLADVNNVVDNPEQYKGRELRVRGFVKPGSILRYKDKADFVISLDGKELKVHFDGSTQLPDTFTDGAPARVDGVLKENALYSSKVEAKCASKYEANYAEGKAPVGK